MSFFGLESELILPTFQQQLVAIVFALLLLALIIFLAVRRVFAEAYSMLWLLTGLAILLLSVYPESLAPVSALTGIVEASSILFLFGIVFLLVICLFITAVVSQQKMKITKLSIRLALLENRIEGTMEQCRKST